MFLEEIIDDLRPNSEFSKHIEGGERYYKLLEIEKAIARNEVDEIQVSDDGILLTPFYIDDGIYELYFYEMNINVVNCIRKAKGEDEFDSWADELRKSLTVYDVSQDNPVVPKSIFEDYFSYLKTSYLVKSDIVAVFKKKPEMDKLYITIQ